MLLKRIAHHSLAAAVLVLAAPQWTMLAAETPLVVTAGKSLVLDNPLNIQRVALADGSLAEAVAVNPKEVVINARAPGETTLIIWQQNGPRLMFDLTVRPNTSKLDAVRQQITKEMPGQDISVDAAGADVFLRGTVKDVMTADRAAALAGTLGKVVNLLHVTVPPVEPQILLRVKFADVDRSASSEFGLNLVSTGALNMPGAITTGQFSPPKLDVKGNSAVVTLTDALNLFFVRPDLNLGGTIRALQARNLLQILAEPNVLAMNGKPASFLAGGEFPVPVVQGGTNVGVVTIQFHEFGVRLNFLPTITPRGTIRLEVTPEVSSLDYNNGVVLQGFTVPAIATRRVHTEIELESGQSFAVAGLLDNRMTETFDRIPGIGNIPILGKLFQSRIQNKNNSELMVLVTPELVRPIPSDQTPPSVAMPKPFLKDAPKAAPRTPGMEVTGPVPVKPERESVPLEELKEIQKQEQGAVPGSVSPQVQYVVVPLNAPSLQGNPTLAQPAPAAVPAPASGPVR